MAAHSQNLELHMFAIKCYTAVIIERIKDTHTPFYRPPLLQEESAGVHPGILTLMKQCWAEEPSDRPTFVEVAKALRTINKGKYESYFFNRWILWHLA